MILKHFSHQSEVYEGTIDLSWKWQNKFTKTVKLSIIYNETFHSVEFYRKIKFANLLPN